MMISNQDKLMVAYQCIVNPNPGWVVVGRGSERIELNDYNEYGRVASSSVGSAACC